VINTAQVEVAGDTNAANDSDSDLTEVGRGLHSLLVNGTTGYAEVPNAPALNPPGDWTLELWFKDDSPKGFEHDYVNLLNKGDRQTNAEAPYSVALGYGQLLVGTRHDWADEALNYDLRLAGIDPSKWHHLAATFQANTRTVTIYLDGVRVAQGVWTRASRGNTLPLQIGRNGPSTGKLFTGQLDDVRIWNVARSAADVSRSYREQLDSTEPGLAANWRFDEGSGRTAADMVGGLPATLSPGASFSTDVHP
jgi:hypothetical protein